MFLAIFHVIDGSFAIYDVWLCFIYFQVFCLLVLNPSLTHIYFLSSVLLTRQKIFLGYQYLCTIHNRRMDFFGEQRAKQMQKTTQNRDTIKVTTIFCSKTHLLMNSFPYLDLGYMIHFCILHISISVVIFLTLATFLLDIKILQC